MRDELYFDAGDDTDGARGLWIAGAVAGVFWVVIIGGLLWAAS